VRESPALDIIHLLRRLGGKVTFSDPYVSFINLDDTKMEAEDIAACSSADCVVIVTDHKGVDYSSVVEKSQRIVDTRNALKGFQSPKIVRL
jgi:UDP-N-acetyl-D-glucosamine dehydrogenase